MIGSRISLTDALDLMDEKEERGTVKSFAVEWIANNGERMRYEQAQKCGLRADVDRNRYIGIRSLVNEHHPHTVEIHTVIMFNGKRIYW